MTQTSRGLVSGGNDRLEQGMRLANEQRIAALFLRRDGDEIVARHSQAFTPYLADGDAK